MQHYQQAFLDFAIARGVLRFGEFVLKSGRHSPYFFNSGQFDDGGAIAELGRYYAEAIRASGIAFDMLYGPAYKGIPLVVATAIALNDQHGVNVPYAFNRKEAKKHGEGGLIVGRALQGRVLIVDDVISAGTSVRESVDIIRQAGASVAGVAISLDRQERGKHDQSAIQEVEAQFGLKVVSIASLGTLIQYLAARADLGQVLDRIMAYQQHYGATGAD
jgi:orotate phosphoribosyltransferase